MRALFISDLHLAENRPQANEAFFSFLESDARGADALYILGDLFEYWIGDDDLGDPFNGIVAGLLKTFPGRKFVMHGNRDFLMGRRFCEASGSVLLKDPAVHDIGGEKTLLMHGDTLCTDDVDYQAWRKTARSEAWQHDFLAQPIKERRREIEALRQKSRDVIAAKPAQIMDVNDSAVRQALDAHGVRRLIHGHTHRPGRHTVKTPAGPAERWVLPDWYGPGGYLEVSAGKPRLVRF